MNYLYLLCVIVGCTALVLISAIIPWAVFTRYVLNSAASWPEPLAVLLTILLTFIGAAAGFITAMLALLKALDHFPALFIICVSHNDPDSWRFAEKVRSNKSLRSFPILFVGGHQISDGKQKDEADDDS